MTQANDTAAVTPMHDDAVEPDGMDATRARIRAEIEERKKHDKRYSDAAAARAMGTTPSVFSQWMHGSYKGDNTAVEEKALAWLRGLEERRLHDQELPETPGFVDTPTSRRIHHTLVYAHAAADLVVIYGEAGVGKSMTCQHYQERHHNNTWIATMTPATSGAGSAIEEIADELGITGNWSRPHHVWREVVKRLRGTEGLLIIDEAQQLSVGGLEIVRSLHDATSIGIAVVGNPSVYTRMTGGTRQASYAQIFGRVGKRCGIKRSTADDAAAIARAWGVAGKPEIETVHQIARKPGGIRVASKTLRMACLIARHRETAIDDDAIRQAYSDLTGGMTA